MNVFLRWWPIVPNNEFRANINKLEPRYTDITMAELCVRNGVVFVEFVPQLRPLIALTKYLASYKKRAKLCNSDFEMRGHKVHNGYLAIHVVVRHHYTPGTYRVGELLDY